MGDAPVYDVIELRRRIVVCFSMSELRELSDALGVGGVAWDRGPQEAARELVRQCERYAGLPALVAKLREVRPLMEWPEPVAPQAHAAPAAPALPEPVLAPTQDPVPAVPAAFPQVPALGATPGTLQPGAPQPAPPALGATPGTLQPEAPQPLPPAPPAATPSAPPIADPYASPAPGPRWGASAGAPGQPSPIWPGTFAEPPQRSGLDPRLIAAGIGLTALLGAAVVIAFLAGRATGGNGTSAAAAPSATTSPDGARRGDGPAALAADAIARSLANVARTCELPPSVGESVAVFARVYERCGPVPREPRAALPPAPAPEPADTAPEPAARPRRTGRGGGDAPPASPAPGGGCFSKCNSDHRACDAHCGPEPTDSGGYATYQRCLGRCLSDSSRCMQACR